MPQKTIHPTAKGVNAHRKTIVEHVNDTEIRETNTPALLGLDRSNRSASVFTIRSILGEHTVERIIHNHMALKIDEFPTNPNMFLDNLPQVHQKDFGSFEFEFGKTSDEKGKTYKKMMQAPKTVVSSVSHEFNENNKTYDMVHFYCLSPDLGKEWLPVVYRVDMLTLKDNPKFFNIKCLAIVAGAVDGICYLSQLNAPVEKGENPRYYEMKSGHTSGRTPVDKYDDVSNAYYNVKEIDGIKNRNDALKFISSTFNVQSIFANGRNKKLHEILSDIGQKKYRLTPFNPDEAIKEYFETDDAIPSGSGSGLVDQRISKTLNSPSIVIKTETKKDRPTFGE